MPGAPGAGVDGDAIVGRLTRRQGRALYPRRATSPPALTPPAPWHTLHTPCAPHSMHITCISMHTTSSRDGWGSLPLLRLVPAALVQHVAVRATRRVTRLSHAIRHERPAHHDGGEDGICPPPLRLLVRVRDVNVACRPVSTGWRPCTRLHPRRAHLTTVMRTYTALRRRYPSLWVCGCILPSLVCACLLRPCCPPLATPCVWHARTACSPTPGATINRERSGGTPAISYQ
jgi:hypothetical protein